MSEDDLNLEHLHKKKRSKDSLTASGIAEYIRFNCCPRFFKLKLQDNDETDDRKWPIFKHISPLLSDVGKGLEEKKVKELAAKALEYHDFNKYTENEKASFDNLREIIEKHVSSKENVDGKPVLLYQVPMIGKIGVWKVKGIADLIAIWQSKEGKLKVRIFELKSSWLEQTAHRIQVAIYVLLLSKELANILPKIEIEGGVINRETNLENLTPEILPKFKLSPLIQDVERLLAENGELNRVHNTPLPEVEYQLCSRCDNCGFNEYCIVYSVENESIALLNLSRGEQRALGHYGVKRLEDLAKLKVVMDSNALRPNDFKGIPAKEAEKSREIATDRVVGAKLDWLVQRAQYMLGGIRPNSPNAAKGKYMPWLTGTGYGGLPEDGPSNGVDSALLFRPDSMIRVYLFVERDYMLDVISLISARVDCTRNKGDPIGVSHVIANLPDDRQECLDEEKTLLESFFKDLTVAITKVANEVGSPDEVPIHLYFFSRGERDVLMEAVRRQPSLSSHMAIRDLLGLRQAIDQPMFSIIKDEVMHRKALKFHSTGLLPILEQACFFERNLAWKVTRKDGSTVDLSQVFRDGLFNYTLPFCRNPDGTIHFLEGGKGRSEGFYPARARFGNQIPIEYLWAAKNRLDCPRKGSA